MSRCAPCTPELNLKLCRECPRRLQSLYVQALQNASEVFVDSDAVTIDGVAYPINCEVEGVLGCGSGPEAQILALKDVAERARSNSERESCVAKAQEIESLLESREVFIAQMKTVTFESRQKEFFFCRELKHFERFGGNDLATRARLKALAKLQTNWA